MIFCRIMRDIHTNIFVDTTSLLSMTVTRSTRYSTNRDVGLLASLILVVERSLNIKSKSMPEIIGTHLQSRKMHSRVHIFDSVGLHPEAFSELDFHEVASDEVKIKLATIADCNCVTRNSYFLNIVVVLAASTPQHADTFRPHIRTTNILSMSALQILDFYLDPTMPGCLDEGLVHSLKFN